MAFTSLGSSELRSKIPLLSTGTAQLTPTSSLLPASIQRAAELSSSSAHGGDGRPCPSMFLKNLNIYWVLASSIAIWFLFIHSPKFILRRKVYADFPLATHLIGAYSIYLSCMFNTLFTPSTLDGQARPWHILIGRLGMVSGVISFAFGLFCAWWPYRSVLPSRGFSIGISIGGMAQIITQLAGYVAIQRYQKLEAQVKEMEATSKGGEELELLKLQKETALRSHVYNMVALFVSACGIPAALRIAELLPEKLGFSRELGVIAFIVAMCKPFGDFYFKHSK